MPSDWDGISGVEAAVDLEEENVRAWAVCFDESRYYILEVIISEYCE